MEDFTKKTNLEGGDKEIVYSRAIKAGKRIYYLDVKKNLKDDLFLAITESKKILSKDGSAISFEKHKIFLYKEDFSKFVEGLDDVIRYVKENNVVGEYDYSSLNSASSLDESDEIKLNIDF